MCPYDSRLVLILCHFSWLVLSNAKECQDALGIESGMIKDNQITASSHRGMEQPYEARLGGDRAWEPDNNMDMNPWIQVQFLMLLNITAVATQGKPGGGMAEYVTSYKVEHSLDGLSWQSIKDGNEEEKIFDGNVDRDSIAIQMFMTPVTCMYIRIYPVTWERDCALRLELYGCNVQTTTPSTVTMFSNTGERRISSRPTSMSTIVTTSTKSTYVQTTTPSTVTTFSNTDEGQISSRPTSMPTIATPSTNSTDDALSFLTTSIAASGDPNALDSNKGSTDGAIIGSVVGVLFVAILIIALFWILRRRRSTSSQTNKTGIEYDGPYELTIEGKNAIINSESVNEKTPGKIKSAETTNEEMDGIYHDVQDKSDEYTYAYVDVNASDSKKAENEDLVYVYAKSQFGGTLPNGIKDDKNKTDAVYHDVRQKPNEYTYIDVDLKTDAPAQKSNAEEIPSKSVNQENPEEGWEDNSIYATENNAGEAETQEGWEDNSLYVATDNDGQYDTDKNREGWEDNTIYAATDDGDQNGGAGRQNEGWEDNIIYTVGDNLK